MNATFVMTRERAERKRLLRQLEVRPAITVEGEASIRINADCKLRDIFLLASKSITHAITCVGYVWECNSGCSFSDFLSRTLDLLVCNLYVLVEIHSVITWEDQVHVKNERNATFVMTRERAERKRLLRQLEVRPAIAVEGKASI